MPTRLILKSSKARSIYNDTVSYCDTRYKIAAQRYGLPKIFSSPRTMKTQVVEDCSDLIVLKMQHEYKPKILEKPQAINSLISLGLDLDSKFKYLEVM